MSRPRPPRTPCTTVGSSSRSPVSATRSTTPETIGGRAPRSSTATSPIIAAPLDVLGVNYYSRALVDATDERIEPPGPVTAMGWEIYPEGLAETLRWLDERCQFPRYLITENGAAMDDRPDATGFVDDQDRIDYLRGHLQVVHELIDEGIPVGGYFAWSLMDNFEWAYGYTQRFGLIRVDYDTLERTPRRAPTGTARSPAPAPSARRLCVSVQAVSERARSHGRLRRLRDAVERRRRRRRRRRWRRS